jgi:hypothetical protein
MKNTLHTVIYNSRTCIYCDDIKVCNKKPRVGLFRQECTVPCQVGKHRRPPPPPPPPRKVYY